MVYGIYCEYLVETMAVSVHGNKSDNELTTIKLYIY